MLPFKDQLTICFAHVAYRLRERFLALATGIESFEVRDGAALEQRIGEVDVLVLSGLWRNDLLPRAKRLRFIQSIGAGTDQFSRELLKQHGVRLASARYRIGNSSQASDMEWLYLPYLHSMHTYSQPICRCRFERSLC